jgi:hypothetical protein
VRAGGGEVLARGINLAAVEADDGRDAEFAAR